MNNLDKILDIIKVAEEISPKNIKDSIGISEVMVHRYLKKLLDNGSILKIGRSPRVIYKINYQKNPNEIKLFKVNSTIIEENFNLITPEGREYSGTEAFSLWCQNRKVDIDTFKGKYEQVYLEYEKFKLGGYINATSKIQKSFTEQNNLDELYYIDFYSYPIFGKTKLANWLFYGKLLQEQHLITKAIENVKASIYQFILENNIDAIAFVPPTVPRKIQFMKVLEEKLNFSIPKILVHKLKTEISIQQKSLKDIADRITNARNSIVIETRNTNYKNLLIIDDFTGSGATLNIIAGKCKKQKVAQKILGLTLTGSVNGFEVVKDF